MRIIDANAHSLEPVAWFRAESLPASSEIPVALATKMGLASTQCAAIFGDTAVKTLPL